MKIRRFIRKRRRREAKRKMDAANAKRSKIMASFVATGLPAYLLEFKSGE